MAYPIFSPPITFTAEPSAMNTERGGALSASPKAGP